MEKRKHFIALVPMGGKSKGKVSQHAYAGKTYKRAVEWAKEKFISMAVVVEMPWNELSLDIEKAKDIYYSQMQ